MSQVTYLAPWGSLSLAEGSELPRNSGVSREAKHVGQQTHSEANHCLGAQGRYHSEITWEGTQKDEGGFSG